MVSSGSPLAGVAASWTVGVGFMAADGDGLVMGEVGRVAVSLETALWVAVRPAGRQPVTKTSSANKGRIFNGMDCLPCLMDNHM